MRIEFKFGVSVLQNRRRLEIFWNVFVAKKSYFKYMYIYFLAKIDMMVTVSIMATLVAHCYKRNKTFFHGENKIVLIKPKIADHFRILYKVQFQTVWRL